MSKLDVLKPSALCDGFEDLRRRDPGCDKLADDGGRPVPSSRSEMFDVTPIDNRSTTPSRKCCIPARLPMHHDGKIDRATAPTAALVTARSHPL